MLDLFQQIALWFVLLTGAVATLLVGAAFIQVVVFELRGHDDFHN